MAHEQWIITLALAPLTLLLFGQFSVVGLLANALAIPWINGGDATGHAGRAAAVGDGTWPVLPSRC